MRAQIVEGEIEFLNKPFSGTFAEFFQIGEDLKEVVLSASFPNDFRHAAVLEGDRATLPNAHRSRGWPDGR